MAQLTYNSITFSNVDNTTPLVGVVNKYTIAANLLNNVPWIAKYEGGKINHSLMHLISTAVEIDWNGMVLGDKTINTTGELFSA